MKKLKSRSIQASTHTKKNKETRTLWTRTQVCNAHVSTHPGSSGNRGTFRTYKVWDRCGGGRVWRWGDATPLDQKTGHDPSLFSVIAGASGDYNVQCSCGQFAQFYWSMLRRKGSKTYIKEDVVHTPACGATPHAEIVVLPHVSLKPICRATPHSEIVGIPRAPLAFWTWYGKLIAHGGL